MTEELRLHWALHEIDEQAVAREQALARQPALRREQQAKVAAARSARGTLEARLAESAKRRRVLDQDIAAFDAQQRHFEHQLDAVTDQKQYVAVQHEIAGVKAKRDVLENEALERLEAEERDLAALPEKAHALERAEAETAALFARLDAEADALRAELAALDARRAETAAKLPPPARSRYEKLRAGRAGRAIAAVTQGACGGCHSALAPAALQEARRREKLLVCESCGRLLVLPPPETGAA